MIFRKMLRAWPGLLVAAALATAALGGGFYLSVDLPSETEDAVVRDAAFVVRALGCHEPSRAKITAKAEGIVDGTRVSRTLRLRPVSDGVYAVHQEWPDEGRWVVAITGVYRGTVRSIIIDAGTGADQRIRNIPGEVSALDVEAALAFASN